jgi:tetratricopeptide (TPR) repeat protein
LAQLVSKSIVRRIENGRYDLHELMRQYAHARLVHSGHSAEAHRKHALAFLVMAEAAVPRMYGPEAEPLRAQFQPEASNFRAAFEWAYDGERDPNLALRLAVALGRYWYLAPEWREGYQSVQRALALVGDTADRLLWAKAQMYLGVFEHAWGNYNTALGHFEVALAGFRDTQDQWHEAWTLTQIFQCHFAEGRLDEAEATLRQGLQQMQAFGDRWAASYARWQLGYLARARGDYATASQLAEEALTAFRELDDRGCQILASNLYGDIALYQGDYGQAARHYTNSMNLGRSMDNLVAVAWSAHNLGQTELAQGQPMRALTAFSEAWLLRDAIGDHESGYEALQGMAVASAMLDRFEQAAQFFGAAARSQHGEVFRMAGPVFGLWETAFTRTRAALGEVGWATAWQAGQATPVAVLVAKAG